MLHRKATIKANVQKLILEYITSLSGFLTNKYTIIVQIKLIKLYHVKLNIILLGNLRIVLSIKLLCKILFMHEGHG